MKPSKWPIYMNGAIAVFYGVAAAFYFSAGKWSAWLWLVGALLFAAWVPVSARTYHMQKRTWGLIEEGRRRIEEQRQQRAAIQRHVERLKNAPHN